MPIPPHILQNHPVVIIRIDVEKVNGVPFLATYSRVIKMGSATELPSTKAKPIVAALLVIIKYYIVRGFRVGAIAADYAFEAIRHNEDFANAEVPLNATSEDEHAPFIERFNRLLKERCGTCYSTLPFLRMPRRMTAELIYLQIFWISFFVLRDYISDVLSPGAIVMGRSYDYNQLCGPGSR